MASTATAIATVRDVVAEIRSAVLAPPPELTISEWADRHRVLSREASAEAGPWHTNRAPYQRGMMDALLDPAIETVVLVTASQVGKTEVLNNVLGYFIDQDPGPILVIQPTQKPMAEAWSKDRLAPMIRDTPCLRAKVAEPKRGEAGNTVLHKQFAGGHITVTGANSPASLASRPIRILLADEIDRYPITAGDEGDPLELGIARTATFWNRRILKTSTPTVKDASRIWFEWDQSDQRTFVVPCPFCRAMQPLVWARLLWESGRADTAQYQCARCRKLIGEEQKPRMLLAGEWRAARPEVRGIAGFHLNGLYSPWRRWPEIAEQFLKSKGIPELLRVFVNTVLAEPWEAPMERNDPEALMGRREMYRAEVPRGVALLTGAVDIQETHMEVEIRGWGAGEESWLIKHARILGSPYAASTWAGVEHLLVRTYPREDGVELRLRAVGVDTSAYTTTAYTWVRPKQARGVRALKGVGGQGRPIIGRPGRVNKMGVRLWSVGVDAAKDTLFERLKITTPGPGFLHFPFPDADGGADDAYLKQYGGERVQVKFRRGFRVREYVRVGRNEAIDLYVYSLAALYSLGRGVIGKLGEMARPVEDEPTAASVPPPPERAPDPARDEPDSFAAQRRRQLLRRRGGKRSAWLS